MNKRFALTVARRRARFRRKIDWDEELRWLPTPEEARRRMDSRPSFLDLYTKEQIKEIFNGTFDPEF